MDENEVAQAWLHGFVKPQESPDFMLPLDKSWLAQRGGKVMLVDLIRLLRRLLKESRRLQGDDKAYAALVDVQALPASVTLVAVDLERGRAVNLPLAQEPVCTQEDREAAGARNDSRPAAPTPAFAPQSGDRPGSKEAISGGNGGSSDSHVDPQGAGAEPARMLPGQPVLPPPGEWDFDEAIWHARRILERFAAGELQTYEEMEQEIRSGPVPGLTRRYVATVRPNDPNIVTRRGLVCWTGLHGVREPLPQQSPAAVDVRVWNLNEQTTRGTLQLLRLHATGAQYVDILDPRMTEPVPLMIDVAVPDATDRMLLELAVPKGWPIRVALSVGRTLLNPDRRTYTVMYAELPPQLTPQTCKEQIDGLIDVVIANAQQLELWDS